MNDRGSIPAELYSLDVNSLVGLTVPEARLRVEGVGGQLWDRTEDQAMDMALNPRRVWVITRGDRVIKAFGATPLPKDDRQVGRRRGLNRRADPPPLRLPSATARVPPAGADQSPAVPTDNYPLVTYADGLIRFQRPPTDFTARQTAEAAYQHFRMGLQFTYAAAHPVPPIIQLALYTNLSEGNYKPDGTLTPLYVDEPVWMIVFTDYMFAGSGGRPVRPGETHTEPIPAPHNAITLISDQRGTAILGMIDVQDPQPRSLPPTKMPH